MMNLTEYHRTATRLADYLPWAALVGSGVVLNKDGSFQRTAKFRGPDLDSSVAAELVAVAGRINNALRRVGCTKDRRTEEILGCTPEAFRRHIERQFQPDMSWALRSEWHIDHIIPMAQAKDEAEAVRLNHYTNLRPLWAKDNLRKGARIAHLI